MKKIYIILSVLGVLSCLSSCEQEDRKYQGPLFVEFSPDLYGQVASPSGIRKEAFAVGEDQIGVQLIGLATEQALTVNFRMVDQVFYLITLDRYVTDLPEGLNPDQYQTILATAKYGVDYTFDNLSGVTYDSDFGRGSISVSPGSQFGVIPINILQKGGAQFFCVLDDSENLQANKP
ncbi:MAG: hypothetical protein LBE91_13460, partial [Tannerella sp.]|nr:hypothetical protein [Tannerella sp.]